MQRTRARSASQPQARDEEMRFMVDEQLNHVKGVIKWSIQDLERFTEMLRARKAAEDAYIQSLGEIPRLANVVQIEPTVYFGDATASFYRAAMMYDDGISKTINYRRELVQTIRMQIMQLDKLRSKHESRRRKIKNEQGSSNAQFTSFLTRDYGKFHKTYVTKCAELEAATAAAAAASASALGNAYNEDTDTEQNTLVDEQRKSSDSGRDTEPNVAQAVHAHDQTQKRGMAMLKAQMAQMRTQLANATAPMPLDPSKHSAKVAKLKREASDADRDYRKAVVDLERYRKKQIQTAGETMRRLERLLHEKASETRSVLQNILACQKSVMERETKLLENISEKVNQVDGKKDVELFQQQYAKKRFTHPPRVYYEHYERGRCKDILFGVQLEDYALDHQTTVPRLVLKCIQAVESGGGLEKEGIYRISGRQSNVDALKLEFELDEEAVNLDTSKYDIVTITSVLKLFLREMSKPLFPFPLHERVKYSNVADVNMRLQELQFKLAQLPDVHRDTLRIIIEHIGKVNAMAHINKMNLTNLSVIFTPSIFHDHNQAENPGEWCADRVFDDLVMYHETLFFNAEAMRRAELPQPKSTSESGQRSLLTSEFKQSAPEPPAAAAAAAAPTTPTVPTAHQPQPRQPMLPGNAFQEVQSRKVGGMVALQDPAPAPPPIGKGLTRHSSSPTAMRSAQSHSSRPGIPPRKESLRLAHNPRSASISAGINVSAVLSQASPGADGKQDRCGASTTAHLSPLTEHTSTLPTTPAVSFTPTPPQPPPKNLHIEQK